MMDRVEWSLCHTVGCTSVFSRWWGWPHRLVCTPLVLWRMRQSTTSVVRDA